MNYAKTKLLGGEVSPAAPYYLGTLMYWTDLISKSVVIPIVH